MGKKGQIEMMGLVIVVILIALIIIFVIRFAVLGSRNETIPETKTSIQANNLLNALTKYSINGKQMADVIGNCCNGGQSSCQLVNSNVDGIIKKSIGDLVYYFSVDNCDALKSNKVLNCNTIIAASPYPIKAANGIYTINLKLCQKQ